MSKSPAVIVATESARKEAEVVTLSTGVRARIVPVAATLIDSAISHIKPPVVPEFYIEDKGRSEPNPNDPAYLAALRDYERQQSMASIDVMVLMGVELVDPLPKDTSWIKKLQRLEKLGHISLADYDFDDELDAEFLYKRYIAVGNPDYALITQKMGVTEDDLRAAETSFPSDEARSTDRPVPAEQ